MTGEKVKLHGAQETLLVTLCAKAGESELSDSLLKDRFAARALARIDYDFGRLKIDPAPTSMMMIAMTQAKIGLSMKILDMAGQPARPLPVPLLPSWPFCPSLPPPERIFCGDPAGTGLTA